MADPEARLRVAIDALIGQLDRRHLRGLRKQGYMCSASCCDSAAGHEELQSCVESCQRPIAVAEETLSNELQNFQRGLALCANSCQESVNAELNKASAGGKQQPDKVTMDRLQLKVDTCTNRCIEDCLTNLPPLQKRVDTSLSRLGGA